MTSTPRLSVDEFLKLPETKPYGELIHGRVAQKPNPDQAHALLQMYLMVALHEHVSPSRLGRVLPNVHCIFGPPDDLRVLVPDISLFLPGQLPTGDLRRHSYPRNAPAVTVEITVREEPAAAFAERIQFCLRHGVRLIWVVDPYAELVFAFTPDSEAQILTAADTLDGGMVLPGFRLPVVDILAELEIGSAPPSRGYTMTREKRSHSKGGGS